MSSSSIGIAARLVAALVAVALGAALAGPVRSAGAAGLDGPGGRWARPVDGAVLEPFRAPAHRYGPGHRGVDLAVVPGEPVRAAGGGRVSFAGPVAGAWHVVVDHGNGLRTGYSYVAAVAVAAGDQVRRGDVVATAGGPVDDGHGGPVLHFSLRVGEDYADPMALFAAVDLAAVVRLAPVDGEVLDGPLSHRAAADGVDAGAVLGALGAPAAGAVRRLAAEAGRLPGGPPGCTAPDDRAGAGGPGGPGHALLVVGGLGSAWDGAGNALGLPAADLGYDPAEVHSFSYDGDGAYAASDTWGDLVTAAGRLAGQLRARERAAPGREVDLVAHSQGGVVVDVFLQMLYDPADPTYPPLGTVVTLSSPHRGTPAATAAGGIAAGAAGAGALRAVGGVLGLPPADATAVRQLAEGSRLIRELWDRRLPDHVDFTSIAAVDDLVVPVGATRVPVPGVTHALTDPSGVHADHSRVRTDPSAVRAVRLALEGRPPPCTSTGMRLRADVESWLVTRLERGVGQAGELVGRVADLLVP